MQVYEPKWQGVAGGRVGRWVEAEKEKKKAAASVNTQPLTLLQRHQGYGKPAGRSTARFVWNSHYYHLLQWLCDRSGNSGDSPAGSRNYTCVLNIHRQEEPRGKEKDNPWTVWDPNSLDNSKTVCLTSSFRQVKDTHQELADSCFKIIPYVLFAPHSDKAIITLELKIHQGLGISPNPLGSRNSPHQCSGKAKALCSLLQPETDCPAALSYTPTPTQTQAFPCTGSLHSATLTFMGAVGCAEGFSWQTKTSRDLIPSTTAL